jgi:hypothetical protein
VQIRVDGAKEFLARDVKQICKDHGIELKISDPYIHEQNGKVERVHLNIDSKVRAWLKRSGLPKTLWFKASRCAVYVINRSATNALQFKSTPYEMKEGVKPSVKNFRIFGCKAYVHIPTDPLLLVQFTVIQEAENDFKDENEDLEDQEDRTLGYQLSEQEKIVNKAQMDQIIKEMDVAWSKEKRRLTGTKDLTHSSLIAYAKHYRGLTYFLTKIKDYKSMLILQENAPNYLCPAVNARSISLYYKWRLLPKGTEIDGLDFPSCGTWNDPKGMDQFRSAMVALHKARGHDGVYQEPCDFCLKKYEGILGSGNFEFKGGCRQHASNPVLWLTGNPVNSNIVQDCARSLFRLHSAYKVQGDTPLAPSELLKIRGRLLSSNSLTDFQLWTMILM